MRSIFMTALLFFVVGLLACGGDTDDIDDANGAADSDRATVTAGEGEISIFDLRSGDCITNSVLNEEITEAQRVPCDGDWSLAVLNSFTVDGDDDTYPGEASFQAAYETDCDVLSTFFLFPTVESWANGDRTVNCLIEADANLTHEVGTCNTEELLDSTRLACDQPHTVEVYLVVDLPDGDYPGDGDVRESAEGICLDGFEDYVGVSQAESGLSITPFAPTQGTWDVIGARTVACYLHDRDFADLVGSARS